MLQANAFFSKGPSCRVSTCDGKLVTRWSIPCEARLLNLVLRVAPLYLKKGKTLRTIRESITTLKSEHSLVSNQKAIKKKSFICHWQGAHLTTLCKHQAKALCPQTFWHYWMSLTLSTDPLTLLTGLDIIYLPAIRQHKNTHACMRTHAQRPRYCGCLGFW